MIGKLQVGVAVACVAALTAAGAAEPFTAATTDALMWLWADSAIKLSEQIGEVDVPANGVADVNVLLNGLASGEPVRVSCAQGGELYRLQAVPVRRNSGKFGFIEMTAGTNPYVQRRAPFEVFDILRPIADGAIADPKAVEAVRWIGRGPWTVGTTDQPTNRPGAAHGVVSFLCRDLAQISLCC